MKNRLNLFPNRFKVIGMIIAVGVPLIILILSPFLEKLGVFDHSNAEEKVAMKLFFFLGMFIHLFSKEKNESKRIHIARLNSALQAFLMLMIGAVLKEVDALFHLRELVFNEEVPLYSTTFILLITIGVYWFNFNTLKKGNPLTFSPPANREQF